jgi:hypothetical protein
MTHHATLSHPIGPLLAWPICVLLGAVGVLQLRRLGAALAAHRVSTPPRAGIRSPSDATAPGGLAAYLPVECGHVLLIAGMVLMLLGDPRLVMSAPIAAAFGGLGVAFLGVMLADRRCGEPSRWWCCTSLVLESFSMTAMAAGWLTSGFLRTAAVCFAGMAVIAATRLVAGVVRFVSQASRNVDASPITAQLAMAVGMLAMLR